MMAGKTPMRTRAGLVGLSAALLELLDTIGRYFFSPGIVAMCSDVKEDMTTNPKRKKESVWMGVARVDKLAQCRSLCLDANLYSLMKCDYVIDMYKAMKGGMDLIFVVSPVMMDSHRYALLPCAYFAATSVRGFSTQMESAGGQNLLFNSRLKTYMSCHQPCAQAPAAGAH